MGGLIVGRFWGNGLNRTRPSVWDSTLCIVDGWMIP